MSSMKPINNYFFLNHNKKTIGISSAYGFVLKIWPTIIQNGEDPFMCAYTCGLGSDYSGPDGPSGMKRVLNYIN